MPSFFLRLLHRLAWLLKKMMFVFGENDDKDGNLCCAGGVEGHVRCLDLGLAGGVRNLRIPRENVRG